MVKEYGYEYDAARDEEKWKKTKGKTTNQRLFHACCLRSGRDALKAIAREYEPCVALLPALACDSMIFPFALYGHEIRYYRLNDDYTIHIENVEEQIGSGRTLFLYMDYFGIPALRDADLFSLREKYGDVVFIKDRTHDLIWERTSSFQPDYIMASLRKWIAVPDGGLLWGRITKPLADDTSFSSARLTAQCMRHEFLHGGDAALKTEYRKIFSTVSGMMEKDEPCAMSAYSYALAIDTDWDRLRSVRKRNAEVLRSALSASPHITFIQDKSGLSDLYVAFTVPNRDEVQRRLSSMGIFNTIIWPLIDRQKEACAVASFTEENMLSAPCDQRYTTDDMEYIGAKIVRVIADVNQ